MSEITFQSKWFEKCIRDYLQIGDRPITLEDLSVIKYFYVATTHSHDLQFGKDSLPPVFCFDDAGDEWNCCCISNTGNYKSIEEFITINEWFGHKELEIKEEVLDAESELPDDVFSEEAAMQEFMKSVKKYMAESDDYDGVEEDEEAGTSGMIFPEDFVYFTNVEVVRLMSCEQDIHSLKFLKSFPKLRVLEVGEVRLSDLEGIEKLIGLEKLAIWSN